jgi:methyltransferase
MRLILVAAIVFIPMIVEARRASANERVQRARGGVEPAGDVYRLMQFAYPGAFLATIVEGVMRGDQAGGVFAVGLALFAAAKALKWWAIAALGAFWTFRVIVVPGAALVTSGPYAYLRHPNYIAVVGELVAVTLMTGAIVTGPVAAAGFGALILMRIRVEQRALELALSEPRGDSKGARISRN